LLIFSNQIRSLFLSVWGQSELARTIGKSSMGRCIHLKFSLFI